MGCFVLLKVINFEVPINFYRWGTLRLKKYSDKGFSLIFADEGQISAEKTHHITMSPRHHGTN